MEGGFFAVPASETAVAELSAFMPANSFATPAYFEARRLSGDTTWLLGLRTSSGTLLHSCGAFIRSGRLNTALEIISLPAVGADSPFWEGLRKFCNAEGVTSMELGSADSDAGVDIPEIGNPYVLTPRAEYVLDITGDVLANMSMSHRKNVRRGQRSGLVLQRTRSTEGARVQVALMNQSMDRRRSRGEGVERIEPSLEFMSLLKTGAAEIFQAVLADTVLSSVVVLQSAKGAYSYYAGTSPEGMKVSASHFLNYSIAMALREVGVERYNLGGAPLNSSLASYKDAFGAARVPLMAAATFVGPAWRRKVSSGIELYRADKQKFRRLVTGHASHLKVYAAAVSEVPSAPSPADFEFRPLTPEDLQAIKADDASFRERQLTRLERFGESLAYGVFVDGKIAHVSWLLPQHAMLKDPPHVVMARTDEAEITGCETLPEFRGRGIYGYAIANLVEVLRTRGVRRVFMKTARENKASQSGIEKAGLRLLGSATVFVLPIAARTLLWRRFR